METWQADYQRLLEILRALNGVVVAFSGGVDSTLLARLAREALPGRSLAVTAVSPTVPPEEVLGACRLAREIGIRHRILPSREMERPEYVQNAPDRCYHCKQELLDLLFTVAQEEGIPHVILGVTTDDWKDYRPGLQAIQERGGRLPLVEAGLDKARVRALSRALGLSNWNKPAMACLASRIPYGTPVTLERLDRVGAAERFLRGLGFRQVRVRDHHPIARIEVELTEMDRFLSPSVREPVLQRLQELGYRYIALDLAGYRTGSLNSMLPGETQLRCSAG